MIKAGTLDAQENPLANTVTYGVHKFHKFHTLSQSFLYFTTDLPASPVLRKLARKRPTCDADGGDRKRFRFSANSPSKSTNSRARRLRPKGAKLTRSHQASMTHSSRPCSRFLTDSRKTYGDATFKMVPKP